MNNGEIYETEISDARRIAYDIPGNIGWIMYIICIVIFMKEEVNFSTGRRKNKVIAIKGLDRSDVSCCYSERLNKLLNSFGEAF